MLEKAKKSSQIIIRYPFLSRVPNHYTYCTFWWKKAKKKSTKELSNNIYNCSTIHVNLYKSSGKVYVIFNIQFVLIENDWWKRRMWFLVLRSFPAVFLTPWIMIRGHHLWWKFPHGSSIIARYKAWIANLMYARRR